MTPLCSISRPCLQLGPARAGAERGAARQGQARRKATVSVRPSPRPARPARAPLPVLCAFYTGTDENKRIYFCNRRLLASGLGGWGGVGEGRGGEGSAAIWRAGRERRARTRGPDAVLTARARRRRRTQCAGAARALLSGPALREEAALLGPAEVGARRGRGALRGSRAVAPG